MFYPKSRALFLLLLLTLSSSIILAQNADGLATVGEEVRIIYESPHPYPALQEPTNNTRGELVWTQTITQAHASYIAVHFSRFFLAKKDYLVVRSPDGTRRWEYTDKGNNSPDASNNGFWSIPINGDKLIIEIYSKNRIPEYGYFIDKIAAGFRNRIIVGEDNSLDAICYETTEPAAYDRSRAVARLHINGTQTCTGWLLGSEGHIMTNNHCYTEAVDPSNIIVEMMAEGENCDDDCQQQLGCPGTIEAVSNTLVKRDYALDYALLALPNNITDTYGYLQIRETPAEIDERIYIPQHPAGWGKRIALVTDYDDATISSIDQPRCYVLDNDFSVPDLGYFVDTQGGSSGSPVISYYDNLVVGLHHCGPASSFGLENRGVPILAIVEDLGGDIPNHALACDDDYSPDFTFETNCNNGNFNVTATSDLPDHVGSYWGLFQTTVQGSTLTSETIDGDPDTDAIDPILPVQWGNTATFTNLDISGHFYIKHGIWRDGCFTWIETRVALPEYEGVSAFHFENEQGHDFPSGSSFCYGKDIYINGNASEGENRYFLAIRRRATGSTEEYIPYASLGWTLNSTVGVINLSERLQAFDPNLHFESGYQYRVALAIANIENCIGWTIEYHSINVACCDYTLANFNSYITQDGLVVASSNADLDNIPDFDANTWYLVSSPDEAGGDYTFVNAQEGGSEYNYQTEDDNLYYFLFQQVISECGETCFGEFVQGGEIIANDDPPLSCDLIECALLDYYTQNINRHISPSGLVTASSDIDFSYIINPEAEIWYLVASPNETGGEYTYVDTQEGNTYSYQTQDDNLYYFLFHQVISDCGETCSGELVQGGEIIANDDEPISCEVIECIFFEQYAYSINQHISQDGLVTASSEVDYSYLLHLDEETWYLVSSPNEAGGDYTYVDTQEGNTYSYQTTDNSLYYFLFHQTLSACGETCFGALVQGGEIIANDDEPISCEVLGCSIINSNNNSLDISILDEGESLDELTTHVQCGSEITLTYLILPGGAGANPDDIILEATIPTGYNLVPGDGLTGFGPGNTLSLNNIPENGIEVTLTLTASDLLDVGTASNVSLSIEATSPSGFICTAPLVTLISPEICKGDGNGDGMINATDLSEFLSLFGNPSGPCGIYDFDNNGLITAADLGGFLAVFGATCDNGTEGLISMETALIKARAILDEATYQELMDISSLDHKLDFIIYPNPTNGRIFIDIPVLPESPIVRIYDALGNVFIEKQLDAGISNHGLDLSKQPSGIYLILISDQSGKLITSSKIIKE